MGKKWFVICSKVKMTGLHDQFDGAMPSYFFNSQQTDSSSEEKKLWEFERCDSEPCAHPGRSPAGHKTPCWVYYIDYLRGKHNS